jgi:imidazolonepropionase-like amidohydrolase
MMADKTAILGRYVDVINGTVIEDGAILTEGKNIIFAGQKADAPITEEYQCYSLEGGTVLPGFIDCHAHIVGAEDCLAIPRDKMILKATYDLKALLNSGFTAARDMTQMSANLKWAIEHGYIDGPHLVPGGQVLSITSGHGDADTNYPYDYAKDNVLTFLMDGVEGCLKGVRKQFREGAEFIKICATGGVSSMSDGLEDVQFSDEELKVIVEEANRHGSYVAAHCSGLAGAKQALKAGIKTVEHGIHLDEECVEIMKQNGCSLVTTLDISFHVGDMPGLPEYMAVKAKQCAVANRKSIELVHKAGINVALGTDYSNDEKSHTKFKVIGKEFKAICDGGFTEMESLQIGTINGAKVMKMEEKIGSLDAGKFADVVIVEGNPLENIEVLGDADYIRFVMKEGKIYKNTINA